MAIFNSSLRVESMRTGKMRPENIDLNTPRSFWN